MQNVLIEENHMKVALLLAETILGGNADLFPKDRRRSVAQFTVNANRLDPYKGFKFRVKWDGKYVAGVSKISALRRTTESVIYREGGDQSTFRRSPGTTSYDSIVLERGVTHDPAFEDWANLVHNVQGDADMSLKHFRKDIIVDLFNEEGQKVKSYKIYRCWPSEYVALSELNANNDASVLIESLTLQIEGWERDVTVTEPKET